MLLMYNSWLNRTKENWYFPLEHHFLVLQYCYTAIITGMSTIIINSLNKKFIIVFPVVYGFIRKMFSFFMDFLPTPTYGRNERNKERMNHCSTTFPK